MFSKISRYRKLPDIVTTDVKGRNSESKSLRLLPEVSGTFLHTVEEVDRLDHLAFKFYRQPRKWWRICDANPEFMSPQALLGKEPIVTYRFPLTPAVNGVHPPWAELLKQLGEIVGVENLQVVEEVQLLSETQTYERAIIVTYNQMNVNAGELAGVITAALRFNIDSSFQIDLDSNSISADLRQVFENNGISLSQNATISTEEQNSQWLIIDGARTYTVRKEKGLLNIDIGVSQPENIGRIGKQIIIPPNVVG